MKTGGKVSGKASVPGDSPKNDTVKAMLSPGEIVIPRSIAQSDNAPEKAKAFVEKSKGSNPLDGFKKIHQDDSRTILQHAKGHQLIVAHKALGGEMKACINALPHYNDGTAPGGVPSSDEEDEPSSAETEALNQESAPEEKPGLLSQIGSAYAAPLKSAFYTVASGTVGALNTAQDIGTRMQPYAQPFLK